MFWLIILGYILSWQQEHEVGGSVASIVRRQNELNVHHAQPLPLSVDQFNPMMQCSCSQDVSSHLHTPSLEMSPRQI